MMLAMKPLESSGIIWQDNQLRVEDQWLLDLNFRLDRFQLLLPVEVLPVLHLHLGQEEEFLSRELHLVVHQVYHQDLPVSITEFFYPSPFSPILLKKAYWAGYDR